MKNREVFDRDPITTPLANNGQARITDRLEEKEVAELMRHSAVLREGAVVVARDQEHGRATGACQRLDETG